MRQLILHLILQQATTRGAFEAVTLFVDTSGFTPLTQALMAHGAAGAEAIAVACLNRWLQLCMHTMALLRAL